MHALGVQRALVFMNFQQRLKDTGGHGLPAGRVPGDLLRNKYSVGGFRPPPGRQACERALGGTRKSNTYCT